MAANDIVRAKTLVPRKVSVWVRCEVLVQCLACNEACINNCHYPYYSYYLIIIIFHEVRVTDTGLLESLNEFSPWHK